MKVWRHKLVIFSILLAACASKRPLTVPIGQIYFPAPAEQTAIHERQLLVLLPGIGGKLSDFERYGFVTTVQQQYPLMDVILVDAHFAYYKQRVFLDRLHQDVMLPARQKGYCRIHLAGISLGGYGSLLYYRQHGDVPDSVSLLAPYLGEAQFYQHLLDSSKTVQGQEDDLNLWPWLGNLSVEQKAAVFLAYGAQDKFADSNGLLAGLLPTGHSFTIAGKHRWPVWQALWQQGIGSGQLVPAKLCPNE